jgi:hypothetical protein
MRLVLHIFIKDARRFWWEIAVTLGLLAGVARMDATRVGFIPGAMEGWLNLILPAVWAYLVALVIHDEALVGDRQFWLTRPYPWPALLAAKALFVLVFIHSFSFAADVAIVAARGFEPLAYLPQLLLKQLALAAALTVPAAALAAVTRNLPQFIFAGVAIATVGLFSLARIEPPYPWVPVDEVRRALVLAVLAPFGTVIVLLQYARRWTAPSRALGLTGALLGGVLFMYLPHSFSASLGCGASQAPAAGHTLSIRLAPRNEPGPHGGYPRYIEQIRIPVVVSGIPENTTVEFDPLAFAIIGPGGERWEANKPRERLDADTISDSLWVERANGEGWQSLILGRSVYERIKGLKVSLVSEVATTLYREEKPIWMPVMSGGRNVPGLGHCSSVVNEDRGEGTLDVFCESPADIAPLVRVRLEEPASGRAWNQQLGDSMSHMAYPVRTWLSPLNRRQTFFHLINEVRTEAEMQWMVPRSLLSRATVAFMARHAASCEIFKYQIQNVKLDNFVAKPSQR